MYMTTLLTEMPTETKDERIKQCKVCDKTFRDNTKPRNKATCSPTCARLSKQRHEREKYRIENPPKPTQREEYYVEGEYPFWGDDLKGTAHAWKIAVPYSLDRVEGIAFARSLNGRKRQEVIRYNGDEDGITGVNVVFVPHKHTKPSEVIVTKMSREEIERYLSDTYG